MTEIARLRFQSSTVPHERGLLVMRDDGTFQLEPSDDYRDALARHEAQALALTGRYGKRLGLGLIALGAAAVAAGWYLGRAYGSLARNVIAARSLRHVQLERDAQGGLHLRMPGAEHRWMTVKKDWPAGDFDEAELNRFMAIYQEEHK